MRRATRGHAKVARNYQRIEMSNNDYPHDSEEKLNFNVPFPQTILYRCFQDGRRTTRTYEECGCFSQSDDGPVYNSDQRKCQFHRGRVYCLWSQERRLDACHAMLDRIRAFGPRNEWEIQRLYKDMRLALSFLITD